MGSLERRAQGRERPRKLRAHSPVWSEAQPAGVSGFDTDCGGRTSLSPAPGGGQGHAGSVPVRAMAT